MFTRTVTPEMRSRARGCFLGLAIGDALGMPWETMSPEAILAATENQGVLGFARPQQRKVADTANLEAGATTDDWQLTEVVARSLVRTRGRFDLADCARGHVLALAATIFGWGATTRKGIEAIRDGWRELGQPLPAPRPGEGAGNGVAMKVAPLAIASAVRGVTANGQAKFDPLLDECLELGSLTHPDPSASVAAYALGYLLRRLALGATDRDGLEHATEHVARCAEGRHDGSRRTSACISSARQLGARAFYDAARAEKRAFVGAESVAASIGFFFEMHRALRYGERPFQSALAEVVAAGGDTDTNASMVGALIGAALGDEAIPREWREFRPEFAAALALADELVAACDQT